MKKCKVCGKEIKNIEYASHRASCRPKTLVDCYGILVNKRDEMRIAKWIDNNNIDMNTYTKRARQQLILDFIKLK